MGYQIKVDNMSDSKHVLLFEFGFVSTHIESLKSDFLSTLYEYLYNDNNEIL